MATKLITLIDKNEDFIELQYSSIKKFVKGDIEYIVFNNARDASRRIEIDNICSNLGIKSLAININLGAPPSEIVSSALNYMWGNYLKDMDDSVLYIDSDMFFISNMDVERLKKICDIAYIPSYRNNFKIKYIWTGIFFLNLDRIKRDIDFSIRNIEGTRTDTGGGTHYFLKENNYRELYFRFCTMENIEDNIISTSLNGCTGPIKIINEIPDLSQLAMKDSGNRFFPHEIENIDYLNKYKLEYLEHKNLIDKYNFPKIYNFDLIKEENIEKSFIFHYKSANWEGLYNDLTYSSLKKDALKRMLNG